MKIFMKLVYQYIAIFCNFSNHLHPLEAENCDSNSGLVVDEDDNGKYRLKRVNKRNVRNDLRTPNVLRSCVGLCITVLLCTHIPENHSKRTGHCPSFGHIANVMLSQSAKYSMKGVMRSNQSAV